MQDTLKILAQRDATTTTLTDLYTVPGATSTVVSSLVICNRTATPVTFRVSFAIAGAADDPKQYLYYGVSVDTGDTISATIGVTLAATDVIRFKADVANALTVQVFGVEVS